MSTNPIPDFLEKPNGQTASVKYDQGKLPMGLLSPQFLEEVVKVLAFGKEKYGAWNWTKTGFPASRLFDAMQRHLWAWWGGEDNDPESGLSHLAHAGCMLMFLTHQMVTLKYDLDDRPVL